MKMGCKLLTFLLIFVWMVGMVGCSSPKNDDAAEALQFTLSEDGKGYVVTDLKNFTGKDLVIPDTYEGKPVTAIEEYAVDYTDTLESVTIGKNVQRIGHRAFYQCPNIKKITYNAASCGDCETSPFEEVGAKDVTVTIGAGVKRIPANLFGKGEFSLSSLRITALTFAAGSQCTEIGDDAFGGVLRIDTLTLPAGLKTIGETAFSGAHTLLQVTLPTSLTSIGYDAFKNCWKLKEVYNLSPLNIQIDSAENGRVAEQAVAVHTDKGTPSVLGKVGDYRFVQEGDTLYLLGYVGKETDLTLPADYQGDSYAIYTYAFYYSDMQSVVIPAGVIGIGRAAFDLCSDLKYATFEDPEGWYYKGISKDYPISADQLKDRVKAAHALGGGTANLSGYDDETWIKK